jgi:hypothetical protein
VAGPKKRRFEGPQVRAAPTLRVANLPNLVPRDRPAGQGRRGFEKKEADKKEPEKREPAR